jgi:hypothetical protein
MSTLEQQLRKLMDKINVLKDKAYNEASHTYNPTALGNSPISLTDISELEAKADDIGNRIKEEKNRGGNSFGSDSDRDRIDELDSELEKKLNSGDLPGAIALLESESNRTTEGDEKEITIDFDFLMNQTNKFKLLRTFSYDEFTEKLNEGLSNFIVLLSYYEIQNGKIDESDVIRRIGKDFKKLIGINYNPALSKEINGFKEAITHIIENKAKINKIIPQIVQTNETLGGLGPDVLRIVKSYVGFGKTRKSRKSRKRKTSKRKSRKHKTSKRKSRKSRKTAKRKSRKSRKTN